MKNFIKNKKGNKILLGLATASVLTVPAIVAVSCADPVKGTIKSVSADVNEKDKKIELTITGENLTKDQKDWKITYQSNAQLKAGEIKEIREFEIKEVNANKEYTLSFDYSKNPELNKNGVGVIYTVSHRGGKGVPTSEVYVTPEISKVEATVSADNKNVTLVVTGGMLSNTKEKWTVSKIEPKSKEGETEGTIINDFEVGENEKGTKYTLTIKNQNDLKENTTYKVKYDSSEEVVSNPVALNTLINTVTLTSINSVKNVKLTVTGTKLNINDSGAYTVKRTEVGNGESF